MKSKRGELLVSHVHRLYFADAVVLVVFADNQHRLCLVLQFRTNVTARVVVVLVQMEDGVDVEVIDACPCHEDGHHVCCFLAVVDVVHEVSQSIDDDKADTFVLAQGIVYDGYPQLGRVFTQSPEHQSRVIFLERQA